MIFFVCACYICVWAMADKVQPDIINLDLYRNNRIQSTHTKKSYRKMCNAISYIFIMVFQFTPLSFCASIILLKLSKKILSHTRTAKQFHGIQFTACESSE